MELLTAHKYALWSQNSETTHYHNNYIIIVVKFIELHTMVPISEYLLLAYHSSLTIILYILEIVALHEMLSGCVNPLKDEETSSVSLPKSA